MDTPGLLLIVAAVSSVAALEVLLVKLDGRLKLGWIWVLAIEFAICLVGIMA